MANDKIFANGFIFKRNEKAPDFVIGNISIKSDDAIKFIQEHTNNGWVNLKINKSQGGKAYIELDTWEAKGSAPVQAQAQVQAPAPQNDFFNDEPPF